MNKEYGLTLITLLIFLFSLSLPSWSIGDETYKPFAAENYKGKDYKVSESVIFHGDIVIRVEQAKKLINFQESPHYCRAWFNVAKNKQSVFKRYYDDIEPVAFSYGLCIPAAQPPSPYLAIIKNGDYDGRLFLVRADGKVHDVMGGFYFITKDKRYLFSQYASDIEGLVVFDFKTERIVFSSDKIPYIQQWYVSGEQYFFTESEWIKANLGRPTEKSEIAYFYDFTTHQIVPKNVTDDEIASAKKLVYDFDPREYQDCITVTNKSLKRGGQLQPAP